jgi:ABC-2 type transport system permease protein
VHSSSLSEVWWIGRRSIRRTLRQPLLIVPPVIFPLILMAVNTGGLNATTKLPGFPADSFLDVALVVTFMQGALFAAINAGSELATDIQTGFLNRLALTPLRPTAILVGQLAGAVTLALICAISYLVVGLIAGAHIAAGVGGAFLVLGFAVFVAIGFGAIGSLMAIRTGSAEAVQGLFPLLFVTLFLSSMNLPRDLIAIDWFRTIATYNPISYLIEAMRSLVVFGWEATPLLRGLGVGVGLAGGALYLASRGLKTRMERTG